MSKTLAEQLTELKKLSENGILSKNLYEAAVKCLSRPESDAQNNSRGTIVQGTGSVGAGSDSIANGGSISTEAEQNIINGT